MDLNKEFERIEYYNDIRHFASVPIVWASFAFILKIYTKDSFGVIPLLGTIALIMCTLIFVIMYLFREPLFERYYQKKLQKQSQNKET